MISFQNVSRTYNGHAALLDATFGIKEGEFVSVVGKSGAGKSTLIKMITGEEKPNKGRVLFNKLEMEKIPEAELYTLRRQIGVIFQDFRLLPTKTAYENVAFALEVVNYTQREIQELVPQALDMVGLGGKANNFPHELSGGEKQRVAIARAMIHRPELVVADEPTGNLDPFNTAEIIKLLLKINEMGTTLILATHSKDIVNALKKRVITLDNGRIIRDEENGKYILV